MDTASPRTQKERVRGARRMLCACEPPRGAKSGKCTAWPFTFDSLARPATALNRASEKIVSVIAPMR